MRQKRHEEALIARSISISCEISPQMPPSLPLYLQGWRPSLLGWRPLLVVWKPLLLL